IPVTPINELSLMSDSAALTMPRTAALSVSLTLYVVCPSRNLTVSIGPSTASTRAAHANWRRLLGKARGCDEQQGKTGHAENAPCDLVHRVLPKLWRTVPAFTAVCGK